MKLKEQEEIDFTIRIEDVLAQLKKVKKSGSGYVASCPCHSPDKHQSFSVSQAADGKILTHCHACKASYEDVIKALGLWQDITVEPTETNIVAEYDYVDEDGELLYQVIRLKPKSFRQRRPDTNGNWIYNLEGVQKVIYRLPEILQSTTPVLVVEGEKTVDLLVSRGYNATTNSSGALKWQKEFNKYFKGLEVIIIPDNDEVGFQHAEEVSKHVYFTAKSVKIVKLDGLKEKQDLDDWLQTHETVDLDILIDTTEPLEYTEEDVQLDLTEPHDSSAEMAILGAVLKDNKYLAYVVESEAAQDFYIVKHKHVIQAMVDSFNVSEKIDRVSLSNRLKNTGKLKDLDILQYLRSIEQNTPTNLNVENWIKIVQGKSDFRKYLKVTKKINQTIYSEGQDSERLGDSITEDVFNIKRKDKNKGFVSLGEGAEKVFHDTKNMKANSMTGISTGFTDLDEITSGLQKTDLIIIAARPSLGKTACSLNIATNVASGGNCVAFFSLEMSKEQLIQRIISSEARVDSSCFRKGNLDEFDWVRMANVLPLLESTTLFIDDTPAISVSQIRAKSQKLIIEQQNLDLIVVDYIQLMSGDKGGGRFQEVSQISRDLKGLAKELNVPIIALSQLSRAPEARTPPIPMLSDLRECLVGNTKLRKIGGTLESLDKIKKGDFVLSKNDNHKLVYSEVEDVWSTGIKQVYELKLDNGTSIISTLNHPVLTDKGYKKLEYIDLIDDSVCVVKQHTTDTNLLNWANSDVVFSKIRSVTKLDEQEVFDIKIKDTHNFSANGIIVHNSGCLSGNSEVYLPDTGTYELIESLVGKAGFNVASFNEKIGKYVKDNCLKVFKSGIKTVYKLETFRGKTIDLTSNHKLLGANGWKPLSEFSIGEPIHIPTNLDFDTKKPYNINKLKKEEEYRLDNIKSITKLEEVPVYDLTTEKYHNFVANDILVHNSLEQDSDVVMFIYRPEYYFPTDTDKKGLAQIIVSKQRNGPTGTIDMGFIGKFARFENLIEV